MNADTRLAVAEQDVADDAVVVGRRTGERSEHADPCATVALREIADDGVVVDAGFARVARRQRVVRRKRDPAVVDVVPADVLRDQVAVARTRLVRHQDPADVVMHVVFDHAREAGPHQVQRLTTVTRKRSLVCALRRRWRMLGPVVVHELVLENAHVGGRDGEDPFGIRVLDRESLDEGAGCARPADDDPVVRDRTGGPRGGGGPRPTVGGPGPPWGRSRHGRKGRTRGRPGKRGGGRSARVGGSGRGPHGGRRRGDGPRPHGGWQTRRGPGGNGHPKGRKRGPGSAAERSGGDRRKRLPPPRSDMERPTSRATDTRMQH